MFDHRGMKGLRVRKVVGIAVLGALAVAALGFVVMGLWNALVPPLFGLRVIHFWQAMGLLVLSRILFGGFHGRHGGAFRHRQRLIQRWENMTPDERETFKQGFRGRFCGFQEPGKA
jgi:hypothetical protein